MNMMSLEAKKATKQKSISNLVGLLKTHKKCSIGKWFYLSNWFESKKQKASTFIRRKTSNTNALELNVVSKTRKKEVLKLKNVFFYSLLSIKVDNDKEKELKMTINNRYVHMGKEKVAELCALKSTKEIDVRTRIRCIPIRYGASLHRMIIYLFFFLFFFLLVVIYLVTIDRQECKYRLLFLALSLSSVCTPSIDISHHRC